MEERHEIIQFERNNPLKLFMHKLGDVSRHWHESLELLLILAGEVAVTTEDANTLLKKDDVLLLNSNTIHELHASECVLIAVQIKLSKFDLPKEQTQSMYFDCNSVTARNQNDFLNIKRLVATMLKLNAVRDESTDLRNRALSYDLLSELVRNFKTEKPFQKRNSRKHLERLNNIVHYINDHYQEQLTLADLSAQEHLSMPYLSRFFETYMGVNFSTYYTSIRLEHAIRDLLYSDDSVENIALNHGFSDPRAFVRAFKKKYGMIPSLYRKEAPELLRSDLKDPLLAIDYLEFQPENHLHLLSQYLPAVDIQPVAKRTNLRTYDVGTVNYDVSKKKLTHNWRVFAAIGRAKELLYGEVQQMLTQLQREIGFQYIRFHGIFSDDMLVCRRNQDGAVSFSFTLIDKVLDFLHSIGLRPMIQFSFMPAELAVDPRHTIYASPFVISPPKDMNLWCRLVREFLEHAAQRYGVQELRRWLFSVWNEPDTSQNMFGLGADEMYFDLYLHTYRTVKEFDSALRFGSPSLFPVSTASYSWVTRYLHFSKENKCVPEFMDIHFYSDDFQAVEHTTANFIWSLSVSEDPDYFSKFLNKIRSFLKSVSLSHLPLYITEWNFTVSHRNLLNDTCFSACYLIRNFLENYDRADSFGYWTLTDLIEESQLPPALFHGGLGLFTYNSIPKPTYYAMGFLRRLGDELLASGEGYFITRRGQDVAMIFFNYEHCNPLFTSEGFGLTETSRYGVFPLSRALDITVKLSGLPFSACRVKETVLNRLSGSPFDKWVKAGATDLAPAEFQWLKQSSAPDIHISHFPVIDGELTFSASLDPLEVRLVELTAEESGLIS